MELEAAHARATVVDVTGEDELVRAYSSEER
jgi:hypothetical protein